jgi:carboxyl-terminal processing protease
MRHRLSAVFAAVVLMVGVAGTPAHAQPTDPSLLVFLEAYRILRDEALAQPTSETLLRGADAGLRGLLRDEGQNPATLPPLQVTGDERGDVALMLARIEQVQAIVRARPSSVVHSAVAGMVAALRDQNSTFFTPEAFAQFNRNFGQQEFVGIGVVLEDRNGQPTITSVLENSPASESGLRAGDVIVAVDGTSTAGLSLDQVSQMIRGVEGTTVTLQIQRPGQAAPITVTMTRRRIAQRTVTTRLLSPGIGYLRVTQFIRGTDDQVAEGLRGLLEQGVRALVLDLRGNLGGLLDVSVNVASHFLDRGVVVTLESGRGASTTYVVRPRNPKFAGPLVVLVDRGSASAAEIVAGALQDAGIRLVGTRTFGKATVQAIYGFRDGSGMRVTVSRYLTPAGRDVDGRGLTPDIEVATGGATIGSPDDAPLHRAVSMLQQAALAPVRAAP